MPILRYLFPRSSTHQMVNMFYSSKPSTSTDSNTGPIVEPAEDRPEITPEPTKDEIKLDKKMLIKLERLSGLRFKNVDEIENLQADIRLANKLFEVKKRFIFRTGINFRWIPRALSRCTAS